MGRRCARDARDFPQNSVPGPCRTNIAQGAGIVKGKIAVFIVFLAYFPVPTGAIWKSMPAEGPVHSRKGVAGEKMAQIVQGINVFCVSLLPKTCAYNRSNRRTRTPTKQTKRTKRKKPDVYSLCKMQSRKGRTNS